MSERSNEKKLRKKNKRRVKSKAAQLWHVVTLLMVEILYVRRGKIFVCNFREAEYFPLLYCNFLSAFSMRNFDFSAIHWRSGKLFRLTAFTVYSRRSSFNHIQLINNPQKKAFTRWINREIIRSPINLGNILALESHSQLWICEVQVCYICEADVFFPFLFT